MAYPEETRLMDRIKPEFHLWEKSVMNGLRVCGRCGKITSTDSVSDGDNREGPCIISLARASDLARFEALEAQLRELRERLTGMEGLFD